MRPPPQHSHPLPTSPVPPSSFCQRRDTTKTATPQNPIEVSPKHRCPSFQGTPVQDPRGGRAGGIPGTRRAALSLGWGSQPGGGPRAAGTVPLPSAGAGLGWALLASCPCQEHKAPGRQGSPDPGQCQPLRGAPAGVEQSLERGWGTGTDSVPRVPSPRSAWGGLDAAGEGLLSPSLSPAPPHLILHR